MFKSQSYEQTETESETESETSNMMNLKKNLRFPKENTNWKKFLPIFSLWKCEKVIFLIFS